MTQLPLELQPEASYEAARGGHSHSSSSAGNLSSASSSMDFKISPPSSNCSSLPSHLSTSTSIDSALIWFYTSCVYKNFPYKSLSAVTCASGVTSLCFDRDSKLVIAGTSDDGIQAFFLSKYKLEQNHQNTGTGCSSGSVKSVLQLKSNVLTSHQNGSIKIWGLVSQDQQQQQQQQQQLKRLGSLPTKTQIATNFLLPSSYVQIRRHRKTLWIQHADAVSSLTSSPSGFIFSVSWDRSLKIWRSSDMKCLQSVKGAHDDAINSVAALDQFVYTAGADGKIKAWEVSTDSKKSQTKKEKKKSGYLSMVAVLDRHKSSVNALAVDPHSGYLYSASSDKSICVWEREDAAMHMAAVDCLKGHSMAVLSLGVCSSSARADDDGSKSMFLLCSGSADRTVRVWSRERYSGVHSCLSVIRGHQGPVKSVTISSASVARGAVVLSGSLDCQVRAWWVSLDGSEPAPENDELTSVL